MVKAPSTLDDTERRVRVEVISIRTTSLGDTTYVATRGKNAIVVDPQRDIGRFLDVLDDRGLTLTHVLETHVHNDYISGGRDLAKVRDADLVLPAGSGASFSYRPAFHNEEIESSDGLVIRPLHTPGHTPEHTSYVILVDGTEQAVFTGGSLLVGAAGRSDLLGRQYARQLAILQHGSLHRLGRLPDTTGVFPTHGEGSFCTASGAGRTTSTIGREKTENRLFGFDNAEAFADDQLGGLVPYPDYYAHMGPTNRQNPTAIDPAAPAELSPPEAETAITASAAILDGRDRYSFAAGHIPGSIGIELGDSYAPWAGWLLDYNVPLVLVLNTNDDARRAATELARIGFTNVLGVLRGVAAWLATGHPVSSFTTASHSDLASALTTADHDIQILDVRDPQEWERAHISGAIHRYVPDIRSGLPDGLDPTHPVWVVCQSGNRASIAAGLLERLDVEPIVVTRGGVSQVLAATGA